MVPDHSQHAVLRIRRADHHLWIGIYKRHTAHFSRAVASSALSPFDIPTGALLEALPSRANANIGGFIPVAHQAFQVSPPSDETLFEDLRRCTSTNSGVRARLASICTNSSHHGTIVDQLLLKGCQRLVQRRPDCH